MTNSVLRNPRHELYAQGLAAGLTRAESYIKAGFKGKLPAIAASCLERNHPNIPKRVSELLKNSAARAELSRKDILDRILEDWGLARKLGQTASALKAAELYGREVHKMFTERKEIGGPGDFDNKTEAELREMIENDIRDLGWENATIPPGKSLN